MKKNWKRIIALVLVLTMIFSANSVSSLAAAFDRAALLKGSETVKREGVVEAEEPAPDAVITPVDPVVSDDPGTAPVYPAAAFNGATAGEGAVSVRVEAPEGAFPAGTEMTVAPVSIDAVQAAVDAANAASGKVRAAADITFTFKGQEIQPAKEIKVYMSSAALTESEALSVVHLDTDAQGLLQAPAAVEPVDADVQKNEVVFDAAKFSVYAVISGDEEVTKTITYHFLDGEGNPYEFLNKAGDTVTTQIIKNGESLMEVPAPGLLNNQAFNGWYYFENGEYGAEVKFGEPITVTETKDVYIKAHYGSVIYLTFWQYAAGKVVLERKQIPQNANGTYTYDMSEISVPAPSTTLKFMGWSLSKGTDASETAGDAPGSRPLLSNGVETFTEDTDVYPVYYTGLWVVFVSAATGQGASYVESYFLPADSTTAAAAKPADPTMTGYAFDGWYTEEENVADYITEDTGTAFDFNTELSALSNYVNDRGEVVLYGHWKGGQTTYTVVYWKQQVSNNKNLADNAKTYDYGGQSDPRPGTTGTVPPLTNADRTGDTGFEYKRYVLTDNEGNPITGIAANGSSILNVYFDRRIITMYFGDRDTWGWSVSFNTEDTYTGLYGQTLAQNGYSWPGDQTWSYRNNGNYTGGDEYAMSYLGQFVLPDNRITGANDSITQVYFYHDGSSNKTIYYYVQNADGTWPTAPIGSGKTIAGSIEIPEKFDGFTRDSYQQNNGGRGGNIGTWTSAVYENGTPRTVQVNNGLAIRYRRRTFQIKYLNPLNESPVLDEQTLRYGASLSTAKPAADTEVDLGDPGYDWDGKWYKDRACTIEFDFDVETMPLDGTKVYAGKTPKYFYIKMDPNGGQLQTGQATWRWVIYGNTDHATYNNIERNYIEYKGTGTPYYYYYDEFEVDRADDIWNYTYMATNPRTAYYTPNTVPDDWTATVDGQSVQHSGSEAQAWLDTETKYSYEKDAYQLIGWYDITDGGMKPFKEGTAITRNTILQAQWRRTGEYMVHYSTEAVDANGNPLMQEVDGVETRVEGANSPSDTAKYADQSDSAIMDKMGVLPAGYNFVGWYYDGKVYQPGDVFQVLARLADDQKYVHLYPVLEPVETLPVEVIDLTFDPNGGVFTDAALAELQTIVAAAQNEDAGTYQPVIVKNDDGTYTINHLKVNESLALLTKEAVERGVLVNGEMVPGRGYRLKEWNTQADGQGTSFALDTIVGVDGKDPMPNKLYAIWEEVFYVFHSATGEFETILKGDKRERYTLTTGFDANGTVNKTQYTDYYYGGFSVYAAGNAAAAGLTFAGGDVESGTIADSYWTRLKAAKKAELWKTEDTGAVYYLKEVPTSYLAKPVAVTIRDNYGNGKVTALYFLSVTDTNIYRAGGVKLQGTDKKGSFAKNYTLTQNNGGTDTLTAKSLFNLDGYLTVVNNGTATGSYAACQAFWTTYDYVTVYGIEANIKDITIN